MMRVLVVIAGVAALAPASEQKSLLDQSVAGTTQNLLEQSLAGTLVVPSSKQVSDACTQSDKSTCAATIARALVGHARTCYSDGVETEYDGCMRDYCGKMCATAKGVDPSCGNFCVDKAGALFPKLHQLYAHMKPEEKPLSQMNHEEVKAEARKDAAEMSSAMDEMHVAQDREAAMAQRLVKEADAAGDTPEGRKKRATAVEMQNTLKQIDQHLGKIQKTMGLAGAVAQGMLPSFMQKKAVDSPAPMFLQKSLESKQMSAWPHTYQNCVAGTCRGADQIKSHMPCVENLYHNIGEEYKKFGANLKVTLFMRNRCEQYYDKVHVLECTSADEWVAFTPKFPVQSYKVESCV